MLCFHSGHFPLGFSLISNKPSKSQPSSWLIDIRDEILPCFYREYDFVSHARKGTFYESARISISYEMKLVFPWVFFCVVFS